MSKVPAVNTISIQWDIGTAYELFISLYVLHAPDFHGVRASWAAGIRSRIPAAERKFLEEVMPFFAPPICWVRDLPQPKDAINLLWTLRQIPPAERMGKLMCMERWAENPEAKLLTGIAEHQTWNQDELDQLSKKFCKKSKKGKKKADFKKYLDWWARPNEFGEMLFNALQAYHQAFFEEEEKRVMPVLKAGLEHAQELASRLSLTDLIVELSQGVRMDGLSNLTALTIVPAYWTSPLVMWDHLDKENMLLVFGARPVDMPAIPGEMIPDSLVHALKTIADPTRLKILYYLSHEAITPSELARRLHLRAPTVTHHLNELRLAGLVNLQVEGQERHYTARLEALEATFDNLKSFLGTEQE